MVTMNDLSMPRFLALTALCAVALVAASMLSLGWPGMILALLCCITSALVYPRLTTEEAGQHVAPATSEAKPDFLNTESFSRILDGLADPMFITQRGKIMLANRAAIKLLGAHIIGEDARLAIRHPAAAERLATADPLAKPVAIDIVGIGTRDQRWTMQIVPIDDDGLRLLVRLIDRSAGYAAERTRVDFVANASHELRTPLAAILGFVETLSDPKVAADPATRARFLGIVEGEARRMQRLVDDLMSLSRIEADKHHLPETLVDLRNLSHEVTDILTVSLGERGKDIRLTVQGDIPLVQGDRAQLSQLMHNLIDNAAKYGRPGTPVLVTLKRNSPQMLRFEVSDEGEGVAREHLPRLTERFYRVDSGRSRAMGGTGLGLALVKHIVERHRGRLDIASTPGKGTTVTVQLPTAQPDLELVPAGPAEERLRST